MRRGWDVAYWGEDGRTYAVKGHVDSEAFANAVMGFMDEDEERPTPINLQHEWVRFIPAQPGDDYAGYYHDAVPGSRGACKITTATVKWPEEI